MIKHVDEKDYSCLLKVEKQGKHRYYRFARPEVAYAVEAIANLMPVKKELNTKASFENGDIQFCRTCYDHLAGKVAVDITNALVKQKILQLKNEAFIIGTKGEHWFQKIDIDVADVRTSKRHFAKPCLDWTERKYHLAGALGAALLAQMKKSNWVRQKTNSRIMILTAKGESELNSLGIKL